MRLTRAELFAGTIVVILVTALSTLLVEDILNADDSLPPGCNESDKRLPGCRPTGGDRVTQSALALATVALTTSGAVFVAILTARTTDRRQERALTAEQQRHDASLHADSRSQTERLQHERDLADVAELRQLIDKLSAHAAEVVQLAILASARQSFDQQDPPSPDDSKGWEKLLEEEREALDEVDDALRPAVANAALLATRLGGNHELVRAYANVRSTVIAWWRAANQQAHTDPEDRDLGDAEEAFEKIGPALAAYTRQAHRIIKVKLIVDPRPGVPHAQEKS